MTKFIRFQSTKTLLAYAATSVALLTAIPASAASLTSNSFGSQAIVGAKDSRIRGQLTRIAQSYADGSTKNYLLADVSIPLPNAALGIASSLTAPQMRLIASIARAGSVYAQCTLEPRSVNLANASYTLGIKSLGNGALLRWGNCDDPNLAGYDSLFPTIQSGDVVTLTTKTGQTIGSYTVPAPPANTTPATAVKNYAVRNMLESSAYKVTGP